MRKLKLQVQMSVDGYIAGLKGEMDWMVWNWDDELRTYVSEITAPIDCIILGRKLAEGFIDAWATRANDPKTNDAFSRKMDQTPKIVFSKSLDTIDWKNTKLAKGDFEDEIMELKELPGKDIIAYGGGTFVSSLIKENLIDEYHLFVNPAALGDGMTIFKGLEKKQNLKLINAKSYECGIAVLVYVAKR